MIRHGVITPAFNEENLIRYTMYHAMETLIQNPDLVWVFVNDGSEDDTWLRMMEVYAYQGSFEGRLIMVNEQKNQGQSVAMNIGRTMFPKSVEWVHFMGADDKFLQGGVETRMHFCKTDRVHEYVGMCYSPIWECMFDHIGQPRYLMDIRPNLRNDMRIVGHEREFLQRENITLGSSGWVRARAFDEVGGFPEGLVCGEDGVLWRRISEKYDVAFLNVPTHLFGRWPKEIKKYRQHKDLLKPKDTKPVHLKKGQNGQELD